MIVKALNSGLIVKISIPEERVRLTMTKIEDVTGYFYKGLIRVEGNVYFFISLYRKLSLDLFPSKIVRKKNLIEIETRKTDIIDKIAKYLDSKYKVKEYYWSDVEVNIILVRKSET